MTDFTAKMHQLRVWLTALARTLAEFKARGREGLMEREGTGKGRIMGKGGVRERKGAERGKELRVERENGRIKEKGWGRRAERVGWAGLGKGGDGEVKYDLWQRLF